jgi:proline dehydrogenase
MNKMANSRSALLNPNRNPLLHVLVKKLCFDQFNAGETETEVRKTIADFKSLGFRGVILGYAKEVNVTGGDTDFDVPSSAATELDSKCVKAWSDGVLKTLKMVGHGDFLAVK